MTDREQELYDIISAICESGAPVIFKGAMITRLVLSENQYTDVSRDTIDIDADWVGEVPSVEEIVKTINDSIGEKYRVEIFRSFVENKTTAGLTIFSNETHKNVVDMDLDIRPSYGSRMYYYGEATIIGVSPIEIIADKINAISTKYVFRRAKDLVDIYTLSHCVKLTTAEVYSVLDAKERRLGEFKEFNLRTDDIKHAYDKLKRVSNKPPFEDIYNHLKEFLSPFINKDRFPKIWRVEQFKWESDFKRKRLSIGELEKASKEKAEKINEERRRDLSADKSKKRELEIE